MTSQIKDKFLPDEPMCPEGWFNREDWFLFNTHVVCIDFDCFCDICWNYKVELLD